MPKKLPLYIEIADQLRIMISHEKEGSFLPSERELSARLNVERMTLRRAVKVLIEEGLLVAMQGRGTIITRPSLVTDHDIANSEKNILFALSSANQSIKTPFITSFFVLLENFCIKNGYKLRYSSLENGQHSSEKNDLFSGVNGIIFFGNVHDDWINSAKKMGIPIMLVNHTAPGTPSVLFDSILGGFKAVSHLINRGCSRIVFITAEGYPASVRRYEGYLQALALNNIELDENLIVSGNWGFESGFDSISSLIEKGVQFDGILAANDEMALGAIRALSQNDINIPGDVKVVGFDNSEAGNYSIPSLSSVDFNSEALAWVTMTMLQHAMHENVFFDSIVIPSHLVIRESS